MVALGQPAPMRACFGRGSVSSDRRLSRVVNLEHCASRGQI